MIHRVHVPSYLPTLPGYDVSYRQLDPDEKIKAHHYLQWSPDAWAPIDSQSKFVGKTSSQAVEEHIAEFGDFRQGSCFSGQRLVTRADIIFAERLPIC